MKTNRISRTNIITLFAMLFIAFMMTSTASAVEISAIPAIPAARMSSNGVSVAAGKVNGFSFDGLFWTAEEYTQMSGVDRMANSAVVSVNDQDEPMLDTGVNRVFDLDLSAGELEKLSGEINLVIADSEVDPWDVNSNVEPEATQTGMPTTETIDVKTGEKTLLLGGYTFQIANETNMDTLLNQLQRWNLEESPYRDQFYSKDWTYKTVQVADGAQAIIVDAVGKMIAFNVNASIDELDAWEILAMQRLAVVKDAEAVAEIETE